MRLELSSVSTCLLPCHGLVDTAVTVGIDRGLNRIANTRC